MDFAKKKELMTVGFELTIKERGGDLEEVKDIPYAKVQEIAGQIPLPGKAIKYEPWEAPDARKEAIRSYLYEIEYIITDMGHNEQKIESYKVMLKENLIILETPCPGCGENKLGDAVSILFTLTPEEKDTVHGEYKKCVCYNCGNTAIFAYKFNFKNA